MYSKNDRIILRFGVGRGTKYYAATVVRNTSATELEIKYDIDGSTESVLQKQPEILGWIKGNGKDLIKTAIPSTEVKQLLVTDESLIRKPVSAKPSVPAPVKTEVKTQVKNVPTSNHELAEVGAEEELALELESLANRIRKVGQGGTQGARMHPDTIKKDLKALVDRINKEI